MSDKDFQEAYQDVGRDLTSNLQYLLILKKEPDHPSFKDLAYDIRVLTTRLHRLIRAGLVSAVLSAYEVVFSELEQIRETTESHFDLGIDKAEALALMAGYLQGIRAEIAGIQDKVDRCRVLTP